MPDSGDRVTEWTAALERIEGSLAEWLARAPAAPAAHIPNDVSLEQLDARLAQWRACLEQVEFRAADLESGLDADRDAVGEWIARLRQVREILAASPRLGQERDRAA